jgi:hypothetical protein
MPTIARDNIVYAKPSFLSCYDDDVDIFFGLICSKYQKRSLLTSILEQKLPQLIRNKVVAE